MTDSLTSVLLAANIILFNGVNKPGGFISDLGQVISLLVTLLFVIAGLATFLYLIIGGIQWITSGGDAKKTEAAGKQVTNAIIGLVIVAASWAIIALIEKALNVCIISCPINIPTIN